MCASNDIWQQPYLYMKYKWGQRFTWGLFSHR